MFFLCFQNDVRVIPVKIEGDEENNNSKSNLKRPSVSPPGAENSRKKKAHENTEMNKEKGKDKNDKRKMRKKKSKEEKDQQGGHQSRRRSRGEHDPDHHDQKCANEKRSRGDHNKTHGQKQDHQDQCSNEKRRKENEAKNQSSVANSKQSSTRTRQRGDKYEEVHEINIPITLESGDAPDKIYRPIVVSEPESKVYDVKINRNEETNDSKDTKKDEHVTKKSKSKNVHKIHIRREVDDEKNKKDIRFENFNDKENTPPSGSINSEMNTPTIVIESPVKMFENRIENKDELDKGVNETNKKKTYYFGEDDGLINDKEINQDTKNNCLKVPEYKSDSESEPSIELPKNHSKKPKNTLSEPANAKFMNGSNYASADSSLERKKKDSKEVRKSRDSSANKRKSLDTPKKKSPLHSPGSREIRVEKRQSLQEDDMFKDCWKDFSSTLQDVLSRLQELSSELGQSKLLAADQSEESSTEKTSNDYPSSPPSTCSESTNEVCDILSYNESGQCAKN